MGKRIYGDADGAFRVIKTGDVISLNDAIESVRKEELTPIKIFKTFGCIDNTTDEDVTALFKASKKYILLLEQANEAKKLSEKLKEADKKVEEADVKVKDLQTQVNDLNKKLEDADAAVKAAAKKPAAKPKDPKKDPEIKALIAEAVAAAKAEDKESLDKAQDDILDKDDKLKRADAEIRRLTKALELAEQRAKDAEEAAVQKPVTKTKEPDNKEAHQVVADTADTPFITAEISNGVNIGLVQAIGDMPITPAEEEILKRFNRLEEGDITRRPFVKMGDEIVQLDSLDVNEVITALRNKPV